MRSPLHQRATAAEQPSRELIVIGDGIRQNNDAAGAGTRQRSKTRSEQIAERGSGLFNRAVLGLVVVALLAVGAGGWSTTAEISGAVIAQGQIVVDSNVKRIQHGEGGVVSEIAVRNGDRVVAGQVLLRLEDSQPGAATGALAARLVQLQAERARLAAERDRRGMIDHIAAPTTDDPQAAAALVGERGLFEARRRLLDSQTARLRKRIDQTRKEMRAIEAQRAAKAREIDLVRRELGMVEGLHRRQLANDTRLLEMQRQLARHEGEHAALDGVLVRAESQITELELQIIEIEQRTTTEAYRDIREVETRIHELTERKLASDERLRRTLIRAPVSGIVHELAVHAPGAVLRGGETALVVVPDQESLSVEVRVAPADIDHVSIGQRALLRFTALNQRTTPQLSGQVVHVGADLTREAHSTRTYYVARIALAERAVADLAQVKLVPGMPVESFIETGSRTPLSYFLKPLTDSLSRAMREN